MRTEYRNGEEALEAMQLLVSKASDIKFKESEGSFTEVQRHYIEARDSALRFGADVSCFPKRINYDSLKIDLTDEEKAERLEARRRFNLTTKLIGMGKFYRREMEFLREIMEKYRK